MPTDAFPPGFLQTVVLQIAMHLLAACNCDLDEARRSAAETISHYDPQTELELRLVARIIGFNLQANEALAQAADPSRPVTHQIRLRSGAVNLSREADKAERRLQKLHQARDQGAAEAPHHRVAEAPHHRVAEAPRHAVAEALQKESRPPQPNLRQATSRTEPATTPVSAPPAATGTVAAYAKAHGISYSKALQQRQRDQKRVARTLKDAERAAAALPSAILPPGSRTETASAAG